MKDKDKTELAEIKNPGNRISLMMRKQAQGRHALLPHQR
jgi:hypothetical protein